MDVHRCRFVPYPQSAINALAFSHSHISKKQKTASPRLAVGRANGDIEIWNPLKGAWFQETVIKGGEGRSIDELVWTQDPTEEVNGRTIIGKSRLFSVGYTTTVTEWDLEKGQPLRHRSGNHGQIWCLAAQPALQSSDAKANGIVAGQWEGQNLITGCTDGALVLYTTEDGDLQFKKVISRASTKKAKVISVVFQDRSIVVAGFTDSTIRIYDIRTGSNLRSMSLGSGIKGGPKEIYVCAVKVLKNGDIISGDSTGELKIWSGKTYTLMQRIKSHDEDIFTLATNFEGTKIFSGGKDRKTAVYKQTGKANRWAEVSHRRFHEHDVTTMASLEHHNGMSVVVSGGVDATPMVIPLKEFGSQYHRALPFLPQATAVKSAPSKRLVMSFWDREVHIWRLGKITKASAGSEESESELSPKNRKLVAKIKIVGEASITSADLSSDGNMLAVSTALDVKFFQLRPRKDGVLKISKITNTNSSFSSGARLARFSPDSKWLCIIRTDNQIIVSRISQSPSSIDLHPQQTKLTRINRKIEKHILLGGLGSYDRTATQLAFSSDSRILAVSDLAGYVDTFVLSGQEDLSQAPNPIRASSAASSSDSDSESDSDEEGHKPNLLFGQYWTRNPVAALIPKLPSTPTVLSFRPATAPIPNPLTSHPIATRNNPNPLPQDLPAGEDRLWVVTAMSEVFEFEVLKGELSPWSRRNPTFPADFQKTRDQIKGCLWDVSAGRERVWMYGVSWLWMFDLSQDFYPSKDGNGKKRKRGEESGAGSRIRDGQLGGMSRKIQTIVHEESVETHSLGPHRVAKAVTNGDEEEEDDEEDIAAGPLIKPEEEKRVKRTLDASWHTHQYRSVLGICEVGESEIGLEVAIIERPLWDADLPDRYGSKGDFVL